MRALLPIAVTLLALLLPRAASAFCGFYVSGADTKLYNRATHVVLMRAGTRTVLSMQNAYEGPPQDFALVVPVPVVLQKEQVKTLPREVMDHVDQLGAPRLVEYWEQDPCSAPTGGIGLGGIGGMGFGSGYGRLGGSHKTPPAVKIEAQFAVGEYEIVILSATDSTALDTWLRDNKYKIPAGAEPYLRPYVQAGMKFFVAKVDIAKAQMKDGRALLSPLRFHYDSETFSLPIRLGLINAGDAQDLIVSILAQKQRYEAANYPNVVIPTNLDVSDKTRDSFGAFYAELLDETLKQKPGAVVTEYSWDAGTCDPCPGPTLSGVELATLGADAIPEDQRPAGLGGGTPTVRMSTPEVAGRLPPEVIGRITRQSFGRYRLCYENALRNKPDLRGEITLKYGIKRDGTIKSPQVAKSSTKDSTLDDCIRRSFLGLSFPQPEGGEVTVTQKMTLSLGPAGLSPTGVVLTRLHLRYTKDALGEDLVFKQAPPITGGREVRASSGGLEQGAVLAEAAGFGPPSNNFQARYAIRHAWTGALACDNPVRGMWGGPPSGEKPSPQAARDLAFVQRGAGLGAFLASGMPSVSGPTAAPPDPGAPSVSASASAAPVPSSTGSAAPAPTAEPGAPQAGCGCGLPAGDPAGGAAALALSALFVFRRRRLLTWRCP
jgi:hypothetical protein